MDCGGPCSADCPTCSDGIKNQGEEGVDCGGPCYKDCETCDDGVQNQDETGVDCGGVCIPCDQVEAYYVSSSEGDDSNDGRDWDSPWRTMAKVNSISFTAGDIVLFNRGDTWNESLVISSSGSPDKPIVFRSYGSGDKPVIDGADKNLTTGIKIAAGNKVWIRIENFEIRNAKRGIEIGGGSNESYNVSVWHTVKDCYIHDMTGDESFGIGGIGANLTMTGNEIEDIDGDGIMVSGSDIKIKDNAISSTGLDDGSHILIYKHGRNFLVSGNELGKSGENSARTAFTCTDPGGTNGVFERNTVTNGEEAGYSSTGSGERIRYNEFFCDGTCDFAVLTSPDSIYHHNIFSGYDRVFGPVGNNFEIYNNLITDAGTVVNGTSTANFTFNNNVIIDSGQLYTFPSQSLLGVNESHNYKTTTVFARDEFVDIDDGDYHLVPNSSLADAGVDVGLAKDFDGVSIPQGPAPDIGLYELEGGKCVPDCSCNTTICSDQQCPDGCGGVCTGEKEPDESCANSICTTQTCDDGCGNDIQGLITQTQDCSSWECGESPHGCGSCGSCDSETEFCNETTHQCETGTCTPDCAGRECGADGCAGSCGTCQPVHSSNTCSANGLCNPVCNTNWGNCDQNSTNGCEADLLNNDEYCGSCTNSCGTNYECVSGTCVPGSCATGTADCDADPDCETNIYTDADNCGDCGIACTNPHGETSCVDGSCSPTCNTNWGNCDQNSTNGCEADLLNDDDHCGSCTNSCGDGYSCVSGDCVPDSCPSGTANCDADPDCETNIYTDDAHCGACDIACVNPHGTTDCVDGSCYITCASGWDDCDGNTTNGCERQLGTDSDCASCGDSCGTDKSCQGGACACSDTDTGDCDGIPSNGCEADLLNNDEYCGDCETSCGGGENCINGECLDTAWMADLANWWPLDGDTQDYGYIGDWDGTSNGATPVSSGKFDGAYSFDGNDYIDVGIGNPPSHMSLAAWFNLEEVTTFNGELVDPRIIIKGPTTSWQNWGILVQGPLYPEFRVGISGESYPRRLYSSADTVTLNEWHHIVGTYDGSTMRLYYDGQPVGTQSVGQAFAQTGDRIWIGGQPTDALQRPWIGRIDEVMIFDKPLSDSEVLALYNRNLSLYKP